MGETTPLYIGLMSGTSMDGIDAALVSFENQQCQLIHCVEYSLPEKLRQDLLSLCQPGTNEIDRMGSADRQLAKHFAQACQLLITESAIRTDQIQAIGSHGQTIRHRPDSNPAFTLQIGDPNTIAQLTGITTVADFRRRDIAAGGQGAPLAPVFHQALFSSAQHNRAIINIGGMANITFLGSNGDISGFDTGPGNVLVDSWIQQCHGKSFDRDGEWAASGTVISPLMDKFLNHPYFAKTAPKSTGREEFNLHWINDCIGNSKLKAEDVQASLLELTAQTIMREIDKLPAPVNAIYICGGGAYNTQLMRRLEILAHPRSLGNTSLLGIPAQWVEASAFAWLAKQTLGNMLTKASPITGASENVILGGIYPANPGS